MSPIGSVIVLALLGGIGVVLGVGALLQPAPRLARVLEDLETGAGVHRRPSRLLAAAVLGGLLPSPAQLTVLGRSAERHLMVLCWSAAAGFVSPFLMLMAAQAAGLVGLGWYVPLGLSTVAAVIAPAAVHASTLERARRIGDDLRHQVSAYLDVVTMLLAGNSGYEGALEQAARAGDGRLFLELRRSMREAAARGTSLTDALRRTGIGLGVSELEQVAATASLSAAEGAPVARTLAAKCATLRSALATDHESEARLRTSRMTTPIIGMALIFMALVIYPALSLT